MGHQICLRVTDLLIWWIYTNPTDKINICSIKAFILNTIDHFMKVFNIIYFGGTHSDLKSLSINGRPAGRNNQALEGIHTGTINMGACDANNSAKGSVERFINTVKMEEIDFTTRQYQIENLKGKPKSKRDVAIAKDKAITTIVKQHAEGKITNKELLQKYIMRTAEHSLPRELRHLQYESI